MYCFLFFIMVWYMFPWPMGGRVSSAILMFIYNDLEPALIPIIW